MSSITAPEKGASASQSTALTPRQVVEELDRYIIGQADAKRAVAIAMRNRWRRQQLGAEMKREVAPKNILMIGSTGVGKTEIARRLARLTNAPFIKIEATKYTEVGYYGRDVESMVRELVDNAISLVRVHEREKVESEANTRTIERLVDLLAPRPVGFSVDTNEPEETENSYERTRARMKEMLLAGQMDQRDVELTIEQKNAPVMVGGMNMEHMDMDFQGMLEKIMPKSNVRRKMTVL